MTRPALYGVWFELRQCRGHRNVAFVVFRDGGEPPFDPAAYVPCEASGHAAEDAARYAEQLFTRDEADALVAALTQKLTADGEELVGIGREETVAAGAFAPLGRIGPADLPLGGPVGTVRLSRIWPDLPAQVQAWYDLRRAESQDGAEGRVA